MEKSWWIFKLMLIFIHLRFCCYFNKCILQIAFCFNESKTLSYKTYSSELSYSKITVYISKFIYNFTNKKIVQQFGEGKKLWYKFKKKDKQINRICNKTITNSSLIQFFSSRYSYLRLSLFGNICRLIAKVTLLSYTLCELLLFNCLG